MDFADAKISGIVSQYFNSRISFDDDIKINEITILIIVVRDML